MREVLPLFEKVEAVGKMTKDIQQEIFHNLAARYSCIPLIGGKGKIAKDPKGGSKGYNKGSEERLELTDFNTDMIGLCTGPYNNLLVFDLDNLEKFQQIENYFALQLPETTLIQTGKGFHYYYLYPNDERDYRGRSLTHFGFDIRGLPNYVVAPGSNHPNGGYYKPIKYIEPLSVPPEWLKSLSSKSGDINFVLSQLNAIRQREINYADKHKLPIPEYDLDNLVDKFLNKYPHYEQFMYQFPGYKKSLENNMSHNQNSYNPFEQPQNISNYLPNKTQNLLNLNPPVGQRSEPIRSTLLSLVILSYPDEVIKQIILSSPIGAKFYERNPDFLQGEIDRARAYVQNNPAPKKQKIDIVEAANNEMMNLEYYKDEEGTIYCKCYNNSGNIQFLEVNSRMFAGMIKDRVYNKYKKSIPRNIYNDLIDRVLYINNTKAKLIPSICRFYKDKNQIIVDLARNDNCCVEILSRGVNVIQQPDIIFKRSSQTLPIDNFDLSATGLENTNRFLDLYEIDNRYQRHYLIILLLSYPCADLSSPLLYLFGKPGSGKTSLATALRNIFDPCKHGIMMPNKIQDLRLILGHSGVVFIDNFSGLNSDVQNDLCSAYTGTSNSLRAMFTDNKIKDYAIKCPVILSSISIPTNLNPDFYARSVFMPIKRKINMKADEQVREELDRITPLVRGELFNMLARILPLLDQFNATNLSRHASLDRLGQAYCSLVKDAPSYTDIMENIIADSATAILEDNEIVKAFIKLIIDKQIMFFTMRELRFMIEDKINDEFYNITDTILGKTLNKYSKFLSKLKIRLLQGKKQGNGQPYVAYIEDSTNIPSNIDLDKLQSSPNYITDLYNFYSINQSHSPVGSVIDEMLLNQSR